MPRQCQGRALPIAAESDRNKENEPNNSQKDNCSPGCSIIKRRVWSESDASRFAVGEHVSAGNVDYHRGATSLVMLLDEASSSYDSNIDALFPLSPCFSHSISSLSIGNADIENSIEFVWYYVDDDDIIQGPFDRDEMEEWWKLDLLPEDLLVTCCSSGAWPPEDRSSFRPIFQLNDILNEMKIENMLRSCSGRCALLDVIAEWSHNFDKVHVVIALYQLGLYCQSESRIVEEPSILALLDRLVLFNPGSFTVDEALKVLWALVVLNEARNHHQAHLFAMNVAEEAVKRSTEFTPGEMVSLVRSLSRLAHAPEQKELVGRITTKFSDQWITILKEACSPSQHVGQPIAPSIVLRASI